jgi:hypothetical protein
MKRRNKIDKSTYDWDAGAIVFGDPMDAIRKREFDKKLQEDYRALYPTPAKPKSRKKIMLKNDNL